MKIFFTYIILSLTFTAFSQNVDFKKKNFDNPQDYKTAIEALEAGDDFFFVGNFEKALPRFRDAQKLNANNALLNFKIGACYLKIDEIEKSMPYFEKAKELDPKVDPKIDFALAQSYQANGRFEDAVKSYNTYLAGLSKNKKLLEEDKVQKQLDICNSEIQKQISKIEEEKELAKEQSTNTTEVKAEDKTEVTKVVEIKEEEEKTESPTKQETTLKAEPTKDNKKPTSAENTVEKITYRIQISSTAAKASEEDLDKIYSGPLKLTHEKVGDIYKYFIGDFESKEEALKAKSLSGISDAFIVKFRNGKKL